jgi:putrescine transport system substrate-binding protein
MIMRCCAFVRYGGIAAVAMLALSGCGKKEAASQSSTPSTTQTSIGDAETVLNVYNWSDYIAPGIVAGFEAEYGIKVNYDVFDSNEVVETKLLSGHTGYDIVVPSASFMQRQIQAGVFQKLDKAQLPNLKNLDPAITARVAQYDPGNEYAVNYFWGTSGIGYNETKVQEAYADAPVNSLKMMYDPAVISRFQKCGVAMLDAPDEVVGTVLVYLGREANSEKPEDLQAAEDVLLKIRPYIRYVNSSKYIEDLANGDICLGLGWVGDVLQARDRAKEAGKAQAIKFNIPQEGTIMFFDMLAIPADAAHVKNAHLFINYLLRPEIAAKNSNFTHYSTSNAAAYGLIDPAVKGDPNVYPPAETMLRLHPNLARSAQFTRLLTRTWTRFKTGK